MLLIENNKFLQGGFMKELELTRGYKTIVDDEDYQELSKWKWHRSKNGYVVGVVYIDGRYKNILMHRYIMGLNFGDKQIVDHINHNKLDNRRCNLRICSNTENCRNSRKQKNNTSGYKGVFKHVRKYKRKDGSIQIYTHWRAYIMVNGKQKTLGRFPYTPEGKELAKQAYNTAALKYHGEYACLND